MKKKLVAFIMAMAMCAGLVACGNNTADVQTPGTSQGGTEEAAEPVKEAVEEAAETLEGTEPGEDGTYKIAVMIPLSGDLAFFSSYFKPSLDYLVDNINKEGGINGHAVELLYKDDQGDPTIEASALAEVLDENVCAVIGPFMDACGPVVAQWAETNHIPVFMCCALATDVGFDNQSDYVFTAGASAWSWSKVYANAVKEKGYKSVYFVGNSGSVPDNVKDYFWREIETMGLDVKNAGEIRLSGSETDLTSVITGIMSSGADCVVSSLTGGPAITFLQQGNQMGLFDTCTLLGVYINDSDHTESVGDAYPVGKVYSITWFPISFDFAADSARDIYGRSDSVVPNSGGLTFYYALDTIAAALRTLSYEEGYDGDALLKAVEETKCESLFGEIYYTKYNHQLVFPLYLANTQMNEEYGMALPDQGDYKEYGLECYPTEEEWEAERQRLGK